MLRSIDSEKIDTIIHAAALVGGINDNINRPEDYFYENVVMNSNLIRASVKYNVKRFIGILSTCAYPDVASRYPMTEDMLHEGPPAPTNFAYGYAKRAMAVHIDACNKQYGTKYNYLIPCNLYGGIIPEDPDRAHFLDTLLLKINKAKKSGATHIDLMGTGKARRQYMLTDDFAQVIKMVIDRDITESFNVCPDENPTIAEVVDIALQVCDAKDIQVRWDPSKPDGQLNKQASNKKMKSLLPDFTFTSLEEGIRKAYKKIG
jgi:GDP-L-fucose synthase